LYQFTTVTTVKLSSAITELGDFISISLFLRNKHTDASTHVEIITTYEKHLYGVMGSTQGADADTHVLKTQVHRDPKNPASLRIRLCSSITVRVNITIFAITYIQLM